MWDKQEPLRAFRMDLKHYFHPLINYSPGGYLWFLEFFVIVKAGQQILKRLVPDNTSHCMLIRAIAAHVFWIFGSLLVQANSDFLWSHSGSNDKILYHTMCMPTIPIFVMGTLTSKDFIKGLDKNWVRAVFAGVYLIICLVWAFPASAEFIKNRWSNPAYVAVLGYPMMLLEMLSMLSLVPHRPTMLSGHGARSLVVYLLHPLAFELGRNIHQDVFRRRYYWENLTWIDPDLDLVQFLFALGCTLVVTMILGSQTMCCGLGLSLSGSSKRLQKSTCSQPGGVEQ